MSHRTYGIKRNKNDQRIQNTCRKIRDKHTRPKTTEQKEQGQIDKYHSVSQIIRKIPVLYLPI